VINLSGKLPGKEIHLREIADIEYIALETTDDVLLGRMPIVAHLSDNYIVLWGFGIGTISVFDRAGRIVSHFNRIGQGPHEYISITGAGIVFDEKNREIFVPDTFTDRILVYSITGEYKRTLRVDPRFNAGTHSTVFSFDDETLLIYDAPFPGRDNERPFMLLSKKDGGVVYTLNISLPDRIQTREFVSIEVDGQPFTTSIMIDPANHRRFGTDFVIADISSDTMYKFTQNRELTPWLVRTPSVHASKPRAVWTPLLTTDRLMFIQKSTFDFAAEQRGQRAPDVTLMYEFETGQLSTVTSFVNDDFPTNRRGWRIDFVSHTTGEGEVVNLFQAANLRMAYEDNLLKGELRDLTATIEEDDNPVLMIVRFR
jgi:hypothetical protein